MMYQQPVQQKLILLMNEVAFAGNKQKSAQEKQEKKRIKAQSTILVNIWKDLFQEIEIFKQPSAWLKMKTEIDKKGLSKSVTQIKSKLRNMKDVYKKAKDNNSKIGTLPIYLPFYNDFKEMLASRDVINLKYVKEVRTGLSPAKTDNTEKSLQPSSPILDLSK